jgi:hypothetical protein
MGTGYGTAVLKSFFWKLFKIAIAFCAIYGVIYGLTFVVEFLGLWSGDQRFSIAGRKEKISYILTGIYAFFVFVGKF